MSMCGQRSGAVALMATLAAAALMAALMAALAAACCFGIDNTAGDGSVGEGDSG